MTKKLLIIFSFYVLAGCQEMEERSAFGTLERDRISLLATASETIVSVAVAEGSPVKTGDLLLQLDPTQQNNIIAQAEAEVERLSAVLLQLKNGARNEQVASAAARVRSAKTRLQEAERQLQRSTTLREKLMISAAELDKAQLEADVAKAQLEDNQQQLLELQTGSRVESIQQAEAALKSAQAVLAQEHKKRADLSIKATRDGVLEDFPWHLGERVPAGSVAAIMVADSQPYARIFMPEPSLVHYHTGDEVAILIDGVDSPVTGRIRQISQQASFTPHFALHQTERTWLMYMAEITLDNVHELPTGIPVRMPLK